LVQTGPVGARAAAFVPEHLTASDATSQFARQGLLATTAACATLYGDGQDTARAGCTHGVDEFVTGQSGTEGLSPQNFAVVTPPGIPCYDRGPYVHVFYAYHKGARNRLAERKPLIREAVAMADLI